MGTLAAIHAPPNDSFGILHRNPALALLEENNYPDNHQHKNGKDNQRKNTHFILGYQSEGVAHGAWHPGHDTGEYDQGDTIADIFLQQILI